jgi:replication-associated recombination protein RarA
MQLVDKYRPKTLDAFAGVTRPKAVMAQFVKAPYSSAWLFVGPSGCGKTTMAMAVCEAIGAQLHHIPSRSCNIETVENTVQSCHYVPMFGASAFHLVLIDEADRMTKPAQDAFLSLLDATNPPPNTIFIFTANETKGLEERFISRTRTLEFDSEGIDMKSFLLRIFEDEAREHGIDPQKLDVAMWPKFGEIVKRAKGNVRKAIMDLEMDISLLPA